MNEQDEKSSQPYSRNSFEGLCEDEDQVAAMRGQSTLDATKVQTLRLALHKDPLQTYYVAILDGWCWITQHRESWRTDKLTIDRRIAECVEALLCALDCALYRIPSHELTPELEARNTARTIISEVAADKLSVAATRYMQLVERGARPRPDATVDTSRFNARAVPEDGPPCPQGHSAVDRSLAPRAP